MTEVRPGVNSCPTVSALTETRVVVSTIASIIFVEETSRFYKWHAASMATADDVNVVRPSEIDSEHPGRWISAAIDPPSTDVNSSYVSSVFVGGGDDVPAEDSVLALISGAQYVGILFDSSGIWFARRGSGDVTVINFASVGRSQSVVALPYGTNIRGIVATPGYIWVTASPGVWRINRTTLTAELVDPGPSFSLGVITYDADNDEVWTLQDASYTLRKYNATTLATATYGISGDIAPGLVISDLLVAGGALWVAATGASGSLSKYSLVTPALLSSDTYIEGLRGLAYDPVNENMWACAPGDQTLQRFAGSSGLSYGFAFANGTPRCMSYDSVNQAMLASGDDSTVDWITDLETPGSSAAIPVDLGGGTPVCQTCGLGQFAVMSDTDYGCSITLPAGTPSTSFLPGKATWAPPGSIVPAATTADAGKTKLSVAAVDPEDPVAVGDNDPRMVPAPGTHGAILFDNGSAWVVLAPGTPGQWLKTNGEGSDPEWADLP